MYKEKSWDRSGLWILEPGGLFCKRRAGELLVIKALPSSEFPPFFPIVPERVSFNKRNSHNLTFLEYFVHLMQVHGSSPKDPWSCQRWCRLGEKRSGFRGKILILSHIFHSAGRHLIFSLTAFCFRIGKERAESVSHFLLSLISQKLRILNPD